MNKSIVLYTFLAISAALGILTLMSFIFSYEDVNRYNLAAHISIFIGLAGVILAWYKIKAPDGFCCLLLSL